MKILRYFLATGAGALLAALVLTLVPLSFSNIQRHAIEGVLERYLDNHPLTPMVLEAAEEMPDVFTMSHHAHGEVDKGSDSRGKITKITSSNC